MIQFMSAIVLDLLEKKTCFMPSLVDPPLHHVEGRISWYIIIARVLLHRIGQLYILYVASCEPPQDLNQYHLTLLDLFHPSPPQKLEGDVKQRGELYRGITAEPYNWVDQVDWFENGDLRAVDPYYPCYIFVCWMGDKTVW